MRIIKSSVFVSLLTLAFLLTGCGLGRDNATPPSPLLRFQAMLAPHLLWSQSAGKGDGGFYLRLSPVGDQGKIFAASYEGLVSAFDANNGRLLWSVKVGAHISGGLAAGDGKVYVSTQNAQVLALSEENGKRLWREPIPNETLAPLKYAKHTVIANTISGSLTALSSEDGHHLWRFDQSMPSLILHASGQAQVSGNTVVAGFADGEVAALNLRTGALLWERHVAYPTGDNPVSQMVDITVTPLIIRGVVYAATYQGKVAAYRLSNGQPLWEHNISSYSGIAGTLKHLFVSDEKGYLWAFDNATGSVAWKQTHLSGRKITGPVAEQGVVIVADGYGYVHFMSTKTGHLLARMNIGPAVLTQPILYQKNVYVYSSNGHLYAIYFRKHT